MDNLIIEQWNKESDKKLHERYRTIAEGFKTDKKVLKTDVWNEIKAVPIMNLFTDIVSIDINEEMVRAAQDLGYAALVGSIKELPFKNGKFDMILDFSTIDHVIDYPKVLDEYDRVLSFQGRLSLVVWLGAEDNFQSEGKTQIFGRGRFLETLVKNFKIENIEYLVENKGRLLAWITATKLDKTEIIVVKFNQPMFEQNCIQSIEAFTDYPHKLTVLDNYIKKISLTKLWNDLIEKSDCEYICLLNSDTIVTEGWLGRLVSVLKDEGVAVVSCSTSYCGNKRQIIDEYKENRMKYLGWNDSEIKEAGKDVWNKYKDEVYDMPQPSGFCYLVKKSVWQKVGKFNEMFNFYGQESEFNHRVAVSGYKLKYVKGVYIHHYGGVSFEKAVALNEVNGYKEKEAASSLFKAITSGIKIISAEETSKQISDIDRRMAYVRFGDGEFQIMNGWEGKEGNHFNSPELQQEVIEAFQIEDKDYMRGVVGVYDDKREVDNFGHGGMFYTDIIQKFSATKTFYDPVALHFLSVFKPGIVKSFLDKVKRKRLMVIGRIHLKELFPDAVFVEIPWKQAYYKFNEFYPEIKSKINDVDVVLLSAGIAAKVIQKRIWQEGYKVATIDCGSLLDGIAGIKSRSWIINNLEVLNTNFKEYGNKEI